MVCGRPSFGPGPRPRRQRLLGAGMVPERSMRGVCALVLLTLSTGCATTVHRMDGEFPTSAGVAKTDCEKQDWLVVSPTRAEFVDKHGVKSEQRDDGVSLYRIGESRPVSIPSLADD